MVDVYKAPKSKNKKSKKKSASKFDKKHTHKRHERVSVAKIKKLIGTSGKETFLSSFITFPKWIYIESQDEGEEVVLFLRQHLIVNFKWILIVIVLLVIPTLFDFFPPYELMPENFRFIITLVWYLMLFGYALAKIMYWFFNIFILTDERLIDVDYENLFYRVVSDTKTEKVQDVNSMMSGVWQTFFNYGDVVIQTAGELPQFTFQNIPHPDLVAKYINVLIDMEEQEKIEGRVK